MPASSKGTGASPSKKAKLSSSSSTAKVNGASPASSPASAAKQSTLSFNKHGQLSARPAAAKPKISSFFAPKPNSNDNDDSKGKARERELSTAEQEAILLHECGLEHDALLAIKLVAEEQSAATSSASASTSSGQGQGASLLDIARQFGYKVPDPPDEQGGGAEAGTTGTRAESHDEGEVEEIEIEEVFMQPSKDDSPTKPPKAASADSSRSGSRSAFEAPSPAEPKPKPAFGSAFSTASAAKRELAALDRSIEAIPLGTDIFLFDPYSMVDTSFWPREPLSSSSTSSSSTSSTTTRLSTPYYLLSHAFSLLSLTRSRHAILTHLVNLLRVIRAYDPHALLPAVYLVSNSLAPAYDGVELALGGSVLNAAIREVTGASRARMRALWQRTGDAGDVAFEARYGSPTTTSSTSTTTTRATSHTSSTANTASTQLLPSPPLTVTRLFRALHTIARTRGAGSHAAKLGHVTRLLVASRGEETRFLVRTCVAHLRIHAVKNTIAAALARAFALEERRPGQEERAAAVAQSSDGNGNGTGNGSSGSSASRYLISYAERQGHLATPPTTGAGASSKAAQRARSDPRRLALVARLARAEALVRQVRARHPDFSSIVPALLADDPGMALALGQEQEQEREQADGMGAEGEVGVEGAAGKGQAGAPSTGGGCSLDKLSARVPLRVGVPLSPMLGSITRSLDDMHRKMGWAPADAPAPGDDDDDDDDDAGAGADKELPQQGRAFVSEFKYDGQRVQIHARRVARPAEMRVAHLSPAAPTSSSSGLGDALDGGADAADAEAMRKLRRERERAWDKYKADAVPTGKGRWVSYACDASDAEGDEGEIWVRLFSRHLEDMTVKYPDITDLMPLLMGWQAIKPVGAGAGADVKKGGAAGAEDSAAPAVMQESESAATPEQDVASRPRRAESLIMDAEIVAIDLDGSPLPFQTLANRSRKDVNLSDVKVKVGVFAFDLMYLDGKSLLKTSFRRRRQALHTRFPALAPVDPLIARFAHVRSCESTAREDVLRFFEEAQASRCEGIMVKSLDHHWETRGAAAAAQGEEQAEDADDDGEERRLTKLDDEVADELVEGQDDEEDGDGEGELLLRGTGINGRGKALLSTYEPDKRVESWLKVKKDYIDGIGDSLDLVPIGGWHGMGRKAAWWSPVLLALYDPDTGTYQAVCKCMSGFTDAEYKRIRDKFTPGNGNDVAYDPGSAEGQALLDESYELGGMSVPSVLFRPTEVWEIRGADITLSPVYTAALGLVSEERGLSIRFPRFIRRRDDKGVEQASTPRDLANVYLGQQAGEVKRSPQKKRKAEEEDGAGGGAGADDAEGEGEEDYEQAALL